MLFLVFTASLWWCSSDVFPHDIPAECPQRERKWGLYLARCTCSAMLINIFILWALFCLDYILLWMKWNVWAVVEASSEQVSMAALRRLSLYPKKSSLFLINKGQKVLTVILFMETSDKFPQPPRCHMVLRGGLLTSVTAQHPRHRMMVIRSNKRMLVLNQKGKHYQIDILGIHQAPTDNSTCQRWQTSTFSEFCIECQDWMST